MKKFLSILLALALVCSMTVTSLASESISEAQRLDNEITANEQYNKLLQNLSKTQNAASSCTISQDYYGGAYINDDGNLVVCVTDDSFANCSEVQTFTGNDDIIIQLVNYTYNAISQEQAKITEIFDLMRTTPMVADEADSSALSELVASLRGTYIDEERNVLVVEIEKLTDEKIIAFNENFSDEAFIEFEEGYTSATTSAWNPGRKIYTSTSSWLSTGYPVYFTNSDGEQERGFITAGHSFDEGDIVYRSSGGSNVLGVCVASSFSSDTDAALIQITSSSYDISEITYFEDVTLSSVSYSLPSQGSTIYKEGAKSGTTSGTVSSTSATVYYTEVTITDVLKTTVLNLGGDSGGVAYTASGNVVGSMSGSSYTGDTLTADTFVCSYICKVANALDTLDCSIWE